MNTATGSINGTLHKIEVISKTQFKIGDTTEYSPYEMNGTARNIKIPAKMTFKTLEETK